MNETKRLRIFVYEPDRKQWEAAIAQLGKDHDLVVDTIYVSALMGHFGFDPVPLTKEERQEALAEGAMDLIEGVPGEEYDAVLVDLDKRESFTLDGTTYPTEYWGVLIANRALERKKAKHIGIVTFEDKDSFLAEKYRVGISGITYFDRNNLPPCPDGTKNWKCALERLLSEEEIKAD